MKPENMKAKFCFMLLLYGLSVSAQTRLTLEQCRQMALDHDKSLAIANEQITQAEAQRKVARSAYFPKLDANAGYMYSYKNISLLSEDKFIPVGSRAADGSFSFTQEQVNNQWTLVNGQPAPLDANGQPFDPKANPELIQWKNYAYIPKDEFKIDANHILFGMVGLTQPIFMGGKIRGYNRMAHFADSIARTQLTSGQADAIYSTEETYWQVISLGHKVKIAEEYKALMSKLDANLTAMHDEGMATKNDMLKVKVRLNEVDMTLTKANNGLRLSKMALCRLIGLPLDSDIVLAEEIEAENSETNEVPETTDVWKNRSELKSLDFLSKIADSKVSIARSEYMPTIGLTAGYLLSNPNPYNGFKHDFAGNFTVGIAMKVPIFHWGEKRQTVNVAKSERRIAEIKRQEAAEMIELQYTQAHLRIEEANKRMESAQKHMEQAKENMRFANMGFEEGVVPVTGVMEAQAAWYSAYSEAIDAHIDVKLSKVYLDKVSGQLHAELSENQDKK
ncbi:MAG: TolC family protein [Bacteroidales bacterium]|jgi:outer membrane protein TolC|nr:TolC family protein [Bacteroidales bacterium]